MNRLSKTAQIENLSSFYTDHSSYVFLFDFKSLKAKLASQIRIDLFLKAGLKIQIVKNTLNKAAVKNTAFTLPEEYLKGQNAMVITKDPISVANILSEYSSAGLKFKVLSSYNKIYDQSYFDYISKMKDVSSLYASLLGMMTSPMSKLLSVFKQKLSKDQEPEQGS